MCVYIQNRNILIDTKNKFRVTKKVTGGEGQIRIMGLTNTGYYI